MAIQVARQTLSAEEVVALSKQYSLYEWSAQSHVDPIPVDHAEGVYFYTPDGKRYLDFNSQLMSVNIGHGEKRVIDAIKAQAEKLAYANPSWPPSRAPCWAGSWPSCCPATWR